jgi:hypothetical protein
VRASEERQSLVANKRCKDTSLRLLILSIVVYRDPWSLFNRSDLYERQCLQLVYDRTDINVFNVSVVSPLDELSLM